MTKFELDFKLDFKFNVTLNLKFICKPKLLFKNLKTTFISNLDINMRLMFHSIKWGSGFLLLQNE